MDHSFDVFENISVHLPVVDVIKLCSTSRLYKNMKQSLLEKRSNEIQVAKSAARWCFTCNTKVTIDDFYVLFVCTCQGNTYPYYHLECIGQKANAKGYTIANCPKCKRRKPMVICDNAS